MPLGSLSTAFVLAVLLHNAEEALFLPAWSTRAGPWYRPVGPFEFRLAVTLFSGLLLLAACLARAQGPGSFGAYAFFGFAFAMAANAIAPHLVVSLALRRYMPGTATGLALNLPLGVALLSRAAADGWIDRDTMLWAAPLEALGLVALIPVLLAIGRRVAPPSRVSEHRAA